MSSNQKNTLSEICTGLLLLLFVYTGITKVFDLPSFRMVLQTSPLIRGFAYPIAIGLPLLELGLATVLLIPKTREWGLVGSAVLMTLFTGYVLYMLLFEQKLPCSCGGVISQMSWSQHLLFNLFYTGIAILGWWTHVSQHDRAGCEASELSYRTSP